MACLRCKLVPGFLRAATLALIIYVCRAGSQLTSIVVLDMRTPVPGVCLLVWKEYRPLQKGALITSCLPNLKNIGPVAQKLFIMANISLEEEDYFMHLEENRLHSFCNWPYTASHECTAEKLAAAGWYHIPTDQEPDAVRCFVCLKELDGWEPNDDPWKEHLKHSPQCPFLKMSKTNGDMTVEQFFNLEIKRWSLKLNRILKAKIEEYKIQATAVREAMTQLVD